MVWNSRLSNALEIKDFDVLLVLESGFNALGVCVGAFPLPDPRWSQAPTQPRRAGISIYLLEMSLSLFNVFFFSAQ